MLLPQNSRHFQNPKSSYDHFVNKMWIERKNIFEEKKELIFRANKKWNSLNDKERPKFIATAPTPSKANNKITNFFKSVAKKKDESSECSHSSEKSSESFSNEVNVNLPQHTANAASALKDREKYLTERERLLLETVFVDIGVRNSQKFLSDNIKVYLRYKTITSQNVSPVAQIKNFFIS